MYINIKTQLERTRIRQKLQLPVPVHHINTSKTIQALQPNNYTVKIATFSTQGVPYPQINKRRHQSTSKVNSHLTNKNIINEKQKGSRKK